ncbi:MAG: replicative DNA helicase [Bacteroides sp.]|nr:replicative DNA helicase [Bacteroides sp.]
MSEILNPHDAELEEAVLCGCLIATESMPLLADRVRPEMFYEEKNSLIYAAMLGMYHTGKKIDLLTVKEELACRGTLEAVGGPYELARICGRVASIIHLEYHALILIQKFLRREMILGFHKLLALAADETTDIDDTMVDAHNLLDRLEGESGVTEHLRDMDRLVDDTLVQVDNRIANNRNGITGIPTGLDDLDRLTGGWQRGDLDVIAARPSVGKTAFALHVAIAAARSGAHVVIYSLEMQGERLGDRWLLATTPDVNANHLLGGQLQPDEVEQIRTAAAELRRLPIHVDDHPVTSMDRVRSSARMLQSRGKCDMVILDYLQLCDMRSEQKNRNREQEVAQATRKAKLLAKELNVPVLLLSQLNRGSEGRPYSMPALADLRESGAIEQDADIVMLLYRPALAGVKTEPLNKFPTEGLGVVMVEKHRNGRTEKIYFAHNPSMTKIGAHVPPMEWMMKNAR